MKKLDRMLIIVVILLQAMILTRMGGLSSNAAAATSALDIPRFQWDRNSHYSNDTWQTTMDRFTNKLMDWAEKMNRWNIDVAGRMDNIEQRLSTLETIKSPVSKKSVPKH